MYICMHICSYMRLFLPYVLYTVWCLSKSYAHSNNCKKTTRAQIRTNVRARGFNGGLLARSQFASVRSCDRPTWSRFSVVFHGPRANAELVPKFHFALHASHAALSMVTLKILPYTNVTLVFYFDLGLVHPVHGGYGWGSPTPRRKKVIVKQRKLKFGYVPHWVPRTKTNWPTDCRSQCNLTLNVHQCTANYRLVLWSERAPYISKPATV
jgi:hypothetical protein